MDTRGALLVNAPCHKSISPTLRIPSRSIPVYAATSKVSHPLSSCFRTYPSSCSLNSNNTNFGSSLNIHGETVITLPNRLFRRGSPLPHSPRCARFQIRAVKKTFSSFDDMIEKLEVPVLVDFYATWCGPCQYMVPILHDVGEALKDKVSIVKIDSDKYPGLASRYGVQALPTLILFNRGKPIDRFEGVLTAPKLIERIQNALSSSHVGV